MKKTISMLCILTLMAGSAIGAHAEAVLPADVLKTHWAYDSVAAAVEDNWLILPEGALFEPEALASRKMVAQLMVKAWAKAQKEGRSVVALPEAEACMTVFSDLEKTDVESQKALKQLVAAGVVSGYPKGIIGAEQLVTRLEMAVMLSKACSDQAASAVKFTDQVQIPQWGRASVERASALGFISGYSDGSFRASQTVTHAEALQMISQWANPSKTAVSVSRGQKPVLADGFSSDLLTLVNQERTARGLSPLNINGTLVSLAADKAAHMASGNYFSHTSPGGEDVKELFARYGMANQQVGENLLRIKGSVSAQKAVATWMQSEEHRNIILTPYTDTGIGLVRASDGTIYIAQAFASF